MASLLLVAVLGARALQTPLWAHCLRGASRDVPQTSPSLAWPPRSSPVIQWLWILVGKLRSPAREGQGSPLTCPEIFRLHLFCKWGPLLMGLQRQCRQRAHLPGPACASAPWGPPSVLPCAGGQVPGPDDFIKRRHVPVHVQRVLWPWLPIALARTTPTEALLQPVSAEPGPWEVTALSVPVLLQSQQPRVLLFIP